MTRETNPYFCQECSAAVRLERDAETKQLVAKCACPTTRSVRIGVKTPVEWEANE